ncbi:MAG: hypothetical protein QM780_06810 [Hyphomicrobium sp.]|uniref:SGNH/GDSL hydrolase family protein n=1 Tax=Hyphomicrobium sp. TaxID=82 RepID=UPI0039E33416
MVGVSFQALMSVAPSAVPAFVGSGDVKSGAYAYWSVSRAYSAAYAAAGSPAMDLVDQAGSNQITINVLSNGNVDSSAISAWVSAHSVTTIKVKKLYDQSGNGRDVSQATLANMPLLRLTHQGLGNAAIPVMDFSGVELLVSGATTLSQLTGTFSYVGRTVSPIADHSGVIQAGTKSGVSFNVGNTVSLYLGGSTPNTPCLADNFHSVQTVINGSSTFTVVDGLVGANVSPTGSTNFGSPFTIGKLNGALPMIGSIAEIRFDTSVWTSTDCTNEWNSHKAFFFSTSAYEGLVATRCRFRETSDTTNKYANSRSAHFANENLTQIKVGFRNDGISGSAATISASVEYPAGTFTQLTFRGSTTIALTNGQETFSDYITLSIPKGDLFWVREFWNGPSAGRIYYNTWQNSFLGEATEMSASSLTDKTMSGTISNSGSPSGVSRPPVCIVGVTTNKSIVLYGDSIANGVAETEDTSASATGYNNVYGFLKRAFDAQGFAFYTKTISGSQATGLVASLVAGKCSHLITQYGINDFDTGGKSPATLVSDLSGLTKYAHGRTKVLHVTVLPHTTSTDSWATVGNQSTNNATTDTSRDTFNDSLRNGTSGITRITGYIDSVSIIESGLNSNKWIASPSPPYTGDGLHPNSAGHTLLLNSGIVPTAVS